MKISIIEYDEEQISRLKEVLVQYRQIVHRINNHRLFNAHNELFSTSRKRLSDFVGEVISFDSESNESEFYDRMYRGDETIVLTDLLDETLVIVRDYPNGGKMFYQLLEMLHFNNFSYTNEEIMEVLGLPRTTYYRYLKQAYGRFCCEFILVLQRENEACSEEMLYDSY